MVRQSSAEGAVWPLTASRRCCARKPEAPGLVPRGKPFKHINTADSSTTKEAVLGAEQEGGSETGCR